MASLRERELLQLTAEGKKVKEIAATLAGSENNRALPSLGYQEEKLGLDSSAALTKYAILEGITSPNP